MAVIVPDLSAVIGLAMEDEDASFAEAVCEMIVEGGAVVPHLFWYELWNVLAVNERRGRITASASDDFAKQLMRLPFEPEPASPDAMPLARKHGITAYDAAYLELSVRLSLPLATLDKRLKTVAQAEGVTTPSTAEITGLLGQDGMGEQGEAP